MTDLKADLRRYLNLALDALRWKLDGASEYDIRRPLVPTGTNLLGLAKHTAAVTYGYLGPTFDRPSAELDALPWLRDDAAEGSDMYAAADESRELITRFYADVQAHCNDTIDTLDLDAIGHVAWWPPDRAEVTLGRVLVHLTAEVNRHAGHADIVRELIDGQIGLRDGNTNLPDADRATWQAFHDKIETAARAAAGQ